MITAYFYTLCFRAIRGPLSKPVGGIMPEPLADVIVLCPTSQARVGCRLCQQGALQAFYEGGEAYA